MKTASKMKKNLKSIYKFLPIPGKQKISAWRHHNKLQKLRRVLLELGTEEDLFFVKVGAHDGIAEDPCSDILLKNSNWKGLLIEPMPVFAQKLRLHFSDSERFKISQNAVDTQTGSAKFYYVKKEAALEIKDLPHWFDQLSSLSKSHIEKHLDGRLAPFIDVITVQTKPLNVIIEENGILRIDFLHVDTEGHDYKVLNTFNIGHYSPKVIFIEHKHLCDKERRSMLRLFGANGYRVIDCGGDYLAIK